MCNAPEEEFKLEEEDDRALGPIAAISIHKQKKAVKAYHIVSGGRGLLLC